MDELADFTVEDLEFAGSSKRVYWKGDGPAVVLLTEMPGITPKVADCGRRFVDAGYSVAMPDLFGTPGRPVSNGYLARSLVKACVSSEFVCLATAKSSPVTDWLRGLVGEAHRRAGRGVGVVGMCFTGGFALGLAIDPLVQVSVLSQPALPLAIGRARGSDLGLSPDDLKVISDRVADDDLCAIGLRFSEDSSVPAGRFRRLEAELGENFIGVEIDSSAGNDHGFAKNAHSVLAEEYGPKPTTDAFQLILDHFGRRL